MRSLKDLAKNLRALPTVLAAKVAEKSADGLTEQARATFDAGSDPYGAPWLSGKDGSRVDLVETGALRRFLRYVPIGTKLRVALGVPYAKYQIGKRPVFPRQSAPLPKDYVETLAEATSTAAREALGVT